MASALHFGPAHVPSQESAEAAVELLVERGYSACEIDFEQRFWMDYEFAARFGALARERGIVLSVHAPIAGFMGHAERGKKLNMAVGMLDHSAGIAKAAGAELVVFHPGFLLGRTREEAIDSVVEQLGELRARLEAKDRAVPFGIEVMGRVRELGTTDDVVEISRRLGWVRPVLDFAHMHATSDGALTSAAPFAEALAKADGVLERGAPFHIHFSDIQFANRNETKHLRYGEGTLRAEPLAEALARFERPATVISESPDEESSQAIRAVLAAHGL
jgi:deoxyribonuclease-4